MIDAKEILAKKKEKTGTPWDLLSGPNPNAERFFHALWADMEATEAEREDDDEEEDGDEDLRRDYYNNLL